MSLESTLQQTNELLKQVITILQTGVQAPAELSADPAKARYFVCEKYNTVFEVKAGERVPDVAGAEEVSREVYEAKKSAFAAIGQRAASTTDAVNTAAPSQPIAEVVVADAPAQSTEQQEPQPSTEPTADANSVADVAFSDVVAVLQKVALKNRALVVDILKKYLPDAEKPTVPQLAALGKNAEIKAAAEAMLG